MVYRGVGAVCRYKLKTDSSHNIAKLRVVLEDTGKGTSSRWAELQMIYLVTHFVCETW